MNTNSCWTTRLSVSQIRLSWFDSYIVFGDLKGVKGVREHFRKKLVEMLISFMSTTAFDHITIDFRRNPKDEHEYRIDIRGLKD